MLFLEMDGVCGRWLMITSECCQQAAGVTTVELQGCLRHSWSCEEGKRVFRKSTTAFEARDIGTTNIINSIPTRYTLPKPSTDDSHLI